MYGPLVSRYATEYGIPPLLALAMMDRESSGNPRAVSPAGAQGLFQLMPGTAADLGVDDPFDPEQSIRGGLNYLRQQYDEFGSWPFALGAYHSGPQRMKLAGDINNLGPQGRSYVAALSPYAEQPTPQMQSPAPPALLAQEEDAAMPGNPLEELMSNPMFLMGAGILANNAGVPAGEAIGRGLLGGTAAWQAQQQRTAENDLRRQQIQAIQSPHSANITEYEYLRQRGVPHDQAMRYSFAGNAGYGERGMMMGNVPMVQVTNPDGTTSLRPMTPQELDYRTGVIGTEKRTASTAEGLGKQTADLRGEINKMATTLPSLIKNTDQLIADIEAGKYQDTGPLKGRITEYWSPEIADLQFKATEQVLQNLQITNLAPVTIKELELMGQLYAGAYKTPEQNLAVLRYLNGRAKERLRRMRKLDAKLRSGGKIEDLPQWVENEFDPFDEVAPLPEFSATPPSPASPSAPTASVAAPQKPAGMPDNQWQELLRLRGATSGGF
jgi:hypothetical protein